MTRRKRSAHQSAEAWLEAARAELIENGILSVKVERLARRMRVTRGSFYWHFKSHKDLLRRLLRHWIATNTLPFERTLRRDRNGLEEFQAIVDLWVTEREYSPGYDAAVREWARVSADVARVVLQADQKRISVLRRIFLDLGYRDPEALVRARITYFHQVGYYTLGLHESRARRLQLGPYYSRILLGPARGPRRAVDRT
ncbi:MAG TPA: helix-turn-helix domain-containing protein [Steroidobacteraceae bacterium]|nr:helix-turn-helix domain-containing protein [Steroidobacteraceae bacterium]